MWCKKVEMAQHATCLALKFLRSQLSTVANFVEEDRIKAFYHKKDYELASRLAQQKKHFIARSDHLKRNIRRDERIAGYAIG